MTNRKEKWILIKRNPCDKNESLCTFYIEKHAFICIVHVRLCFKRWMYHLHFYDMTWVINTTTIIIKQQKFTFVGIYANSAFVFFNITTYGCSATAVRLPSLNSRKNKRRFYNSNDNFVLHCYKFTRNALVKWLLTNHTLLPIIIIKKSDVSEEWWWRLLLWARK